MFSYLSKIVLRSKFQAKKSLPKAFLPWEKIQKIALILSQDSAINKSAIDKFITDSKKFVEVFYIETKSKQATYADWICFSKKDKSVLNLPKRKVEEALKEKNYDVVINTCNGNNFFSAALLTTLSAPFKCAVSARFQDADLIVRKTDPNNILAYLDDTVRYLKMIRV